MMAFDFAPRGWAACDGQLLQVAQNPALYQLLGTTFGGDGSTFALPDMQGRTPIHPNGRHAVGDRGGEREHTLTETETPAHNHSVVASLVATSPPGCDDPTGQFLGSVNNLYHDPTALRAMSQATVRSAGGGAAHPNMQPFLALGFCIALEGVFPSQDP